MERVIAGGQKSAAGVGNQESKTTTQSNIEKIIQLEEEAEKRSSATERVAEKIGAFAGTLTFVGVQLIFVAAWTGWNSGVFGDLIHFDPYPFPMLAGVLALECVLLASFVLIRQTRMSTRAERRSHLDLQINLLTEKEMTKTLRLLQMISRRLNIAGEVYDAEVRELSQDTAVEDLAQTLRENIEEEHPAAHSAASSNR